MIKIVYFLFLRNKFSAMKKDFLFNFFILVVFSIFLSSCKSYQSVHKENPIVLIETDLGKITIKLYNETPIHRDNFIKLVEEGFYDGITFHRVIQSFMIQGGDPNTRPFNPNDTTKQQADYLLDAEFIPSIYHKRGALAAARMGDNVNPEKKSSGSQFYIVQGKVFTVEELKVLEKRKSDNLEKFTVNKLIMEKANKQLDKGEQVDFNRISSDLKDTIEIVLSTLPNYTFSQEQIDVYTTIGGTPHLDGDYTVFGEVIDGFEVIDKIASVKTDNADRPLIDIRMKIRILNK